MKKSFSILEIKKTTAGLMLIVSLFASCQKRLEISAPNNYIGDQNVFSTNETAISAVNGILASISNSGTGTPFAGSNGLSVMTGILSDELTLYSGVTNIAHPECYRNEIRAENGPLSSELWTRMYNLVYQCNAVIEGLSDKNTDALSKVVRKQLLGEAKFLRAYFYFHLVNLFGDVPLLLTTNYKYNSSAAREKVVDVFNVITRDLKDAQELLSSVYLGSTLLSSSTERVRPTQWAATAFLARVYLYTGEYSLAETESAKVIANAGGLFSLPTLNNVFIKNSVEAIWQLQPVQLYYNTLDGKSFVLPQTGPSNSGTSTIPNNPVYLSPQQLNAFESGDQRRTLGNWVSSVVVGSLTYYYPSKYKKSAQDMAITSPSAMTEYQMMLRLGEQYLINAEARAQLGNISGAQSSLNAIRNRSGLANTTANDKNTLLASILQERQVELFAEMGHRWFDLKRTGKINDVMAVVSPLKGGIWDITDQLCPIPLADIGKNVNLVQNPGY